MKTKWIFTLLGGYELMRDGTQTNICKSHEKACEHIEDSELLYGDKDLYLKCLQSTDEEAFRLLNQHYVERNDDGGGWGTLECENVSGLVNTLRV